MAFCGILNIEKPAIISYEKGMVINMKKIDNLLDTFDVASLKELINKNEKEKKKENVLLWIFAIIGIIVAVAGIAYAVYCYFAPDYLDEFDDEFEDEFEDEDDDDFYEDEEDN